MNEQRMHAALTDNWLVNDAHFSHRGVAFRVVCSRSVVFNVLRADFNYSIDKNGNLRFHFPFNQIN